MIVKNIGRFNKSMFSAVQINECKNFIRNANQATNQQNHEKTISSVFYAVESSNEIANQLLTTKCAAKSQNGNKTATNMMDIVTAEPVELTTKMNMNDLLIFCSDLARDELFYGVLAIGPDNKQINPFHPLVAKHIVSTDYNPDILYRVILFSIPESQTTNQSVRQILRKDDELESLFIANVQAQLTMADSGIDTNTSVTGAESDINNKIFNFIINEQEIETNRISRMSLANSSEDIKFLIPCQILINRLGIPYYGSAIIEYKREDTEVHGSQITPMMTPNLSSSSFGQDIDTITRGSVCTGNIENNKIEGLQRINVANLDSPYFREILQDGWFQFAKVAIEFSLNIYEQCPHLMNPNLNKTYKQTWLEADPARTENDFIQHLRAKITQGNT